MKRLLKIAALILIGSFLAIQVYYYKTRNVICRLEPHFTIDTVSYGLFEETIPQTGRIEIDTRDKETYCVQVEIDELYLSRISKRLKATTNSIDNENYELEITNVYPVLFNGRFNVDMKFIGKQPDSLRTSSLRMRILLSEPSTQLLVPVGGFYKDTGGKWMFVLNGDKATKRQVTLGRKSPDYFEVIEGLHAGDRVITSSYKNFTDYDSIDILEMKKRTENRRSFYQFFEGLIQITIVDDLY